MHLDVHIPYAGTTILWAVILAAVFWTWQRSEGTLSIHSITTQRREAFYWVTVFTTFALGTALGDFTATSLNMDYISKPANITGIGFGNGQTAIVFAVATVLLVSYLAIARPDIQVSRSAVPARR